MKSKSRSCINNGDGNRKIRNTTEVNPTEKENKTLLKDSDQSRRCVDERIGKTNEDIVDELDEDNLSSQREQQFKVGRKNKKRAEFDVEGGGSLEFDDDCDQKATVSEKLQVSVMPYSSRRKNQIRIPHLPKEIISNILVRLPAEIIHDVIRYVSPFWYNIVHDPYFINAHLLNSTSVLFIQRKDFPEFAHSVEIRDTDVKITKIGYPFRGKVCATCDGLVLYSDLLNKYILHVANPVTKQHVSLPSLQSFEQHPWPTFTSTLAYAASTRDYKVVFTYKGGSRCLILTLGIDNAWREIEMKEYFRMMDPVSVGGFVYWDFNYDPVVLCLDVETERFYKITSPKLDEEIFKRYLAMGSSLSLVARDGFLYKVWVLRKPETREWTRMPNIDIEGQRHMYGRILFPDDNWWKSKAMIIHAFAWMKDGEVLIFRVPGTNTYIVHNLKTGQVYSPALDEYVSNSMDHHHPHIHSLVSFRSNLVRPLSFPP